MSADQQIALALRKERLLARIEVQRAQLAMYGAHLEKPFAAVDKAIQVGRFIKARPWITGVAVVSIMLLKRRNLLGWVGRGWTLWRAWRFAQQWLRQTGLIKV